jgi:oligopeptide/dipeptide ABC transporter ATP-binding protein
LERGKTIGVVGESGSGKTVLSRSIMGLLPKRGVVRSGSVKFEGRELIGVKPKDMRSFWGSQMSMIFQDPMTSLNPVMKIGNQITESLRQHLDVSKSFANELAENLLESVRIPEPGKRLKEYPHQLSGGMRQRVCIAVALAAGPKLLFADEPTTALDVTVQAQVLDLMAAQQRERFMAIVLVTHDLGVVAGRADDIAVMYAGRIVEKAPTKTLFANMKMPYTEALLSSIPKLDDQSHTRLATIPGRPPDLVHPPKGCKFAPRCKYVQDKCRDEEPPLTDLGGGHLYRCWFPVGTPEGAAALEKNQAAAAAATTAATTTAMTAEATH